MDDSTSISHIPCNVNRAEEAVLADTARYKKQVEQLIDRCDFSDDEDDECSESENESDPERSCMSDHQEMSMPNSNNSKCLERIAHGNSYSEQSSHTDLDSQHSCCESSNEQCQHSFQTQTQGPSEIPSYIEDGQKSEVQNMNGHSSFTDSPQHSRLETSFVNGDIHDENGSLVPVEKFAKLQEQYSCIKILYDSTCAELLHVKKSEQMCKSDAKQQIHILEQKIDLLNDEKEKLSSHLQTAQTLISDYETKNKNLLAQVRSLENQLADVIEARNEALTKLESSELTVHSLEKQIREHLRCENLSRVHVQNDRILDDLKMRHQKEVLQCKENLDELQVQLALKIQNAESLTEKNSELQQSFKRLLEERGDLLIEMEKIQGKYQNLLKNDTVEELNLLKLQVRKLQDENRILNKQNEALKDSRKSFKAELSTSETLRKNAFSTKSNHNQERQEELNLEQELESSLINVRNLRTENYDLKKQLKDSENEHAHMLKRIRLYEQQIEESEKKTTHLEEELKHLSLETFQENKIKSLEQELQILRIDSLDLTKKLKEATSNEKSHREKNEELQEKIGEMLRHLEEKSKSVELCPEKYTEIRENILTKEKERLAAKAEEELRDVCSKYGNEIASLQKKNTALSEKLFELRTQNLAIQQDHQILQKKLGEVPKSKDSEEVEKELRSDYERQLNQMKEHFTKQKDAYVERCLKAEIERAQIEWANKKMVDIKNYVETTKQRLDEEFQKCLQKERNNFNQELRIGKGKLEDEFNQKLQSLKMQYDKEKYEQSSQLKQDLQSKWLKERALLKENYEKEVMHTQQQLEYKLSLAERELKYLKEKLSINSEAQEEIEKIKQEYLQKQLLFEQEKEQLLSSKAEHNENLKVLVETEKRLRKKLLKYERHTVAIKNKHEEEVIRLQSQITDLQKSCQERLVELSEKFRKICRTSETQTEEEIVPKNIALSMETKFFKCLKNISDEIRQYLIKSNTRKAERFHSSLQFYHQQMYTKNLQDISNDLCSFTPTIIIPKAPTRSVSSSNSKDTFASSQDFHNGKFTTSTPGLFHSSNKQLVSSEIGINRNSTAGKCNSSPNLNAQTTKPKTVSNFSQNSDIFKNYFTTIYKNCTPAMDMMGLGDVSSFPKKVTFTNRHSLENGKDIGSVENLGDISYDFIPTNLHAGVCGPDKFPNGGLFGNGNF